eukprot:TRINITY_DN3235_c0_g1_i1.p1 TRINITY_DN3235_c0_g1~~TRINITY_DN3235_c0_g1_i1.p1  ORF type:complete len:429 (-),score=71.33 TRINITY_DN3235_c0_g1_i1:101-1387(-)
MNKSFKLLLLGAIFVRVLLFQQGFYEVFGNRNEVITPVSSYKRVKEGLYLVDAGNSPYAGTVYLQPPLLLALFYPLHNLDVIFTQLFYVSLDIIFALVLRSISFMTKESESFSNLIATLYLFNPFTIFSCIGMSTTNINNTSIIVALFYAHKGNIPLTSFFIALASYLTIYPIVLVPPLIVLLHKYNQKTPSPPRSRSHSTPPNTTDKPTYTTIFSTTTCFLLFLGWLLWLSYKLLHSWDFLQESYLSMVGGLDLTPTIGLFWYFFVEIFEHFRSLFLFVFQYHPFVYVAPLTLRLYRHPMVLFWTLTAIISILKAYPSVSDLSLHLSIIPLLRSNVNGSILSLTGVKNATLVGVAMFYCTILSPILWHMWIYQGTGNANFYYAANLVMTLAHIILIVDIVSSVFKSNFIAKHANEIANDSYQNGENE